MRRLGPLAMLASLCIAGCGGGSAEPRHEGEAKGSEEQELQEAQKRIPKADRVAYFQIATTSGLLRTRAAELARGLPVSVGTAKLRAARARVARSRPRAATLVLARRIELTALFAALTGGASRARAVLAQVERVNAQLHRFDRRNAASGALVPD
jgi:hypothetical protein